MNAKNNEIKKALTKAVKDARMAYAEAHLDELTGKLIKGLEDDKARAIKWAEEAKEEIKKIDSDPTYRILKNPGRLGANWYRDRERCEATERINRLPEDLLKIDQKIAALRTDAKHARNEAFKLAHLEARMNAQQSKKNTFTLMKAWISHDGVTIDDGIADAAADTMEAWMKAAGIEYRRTIEDKKQWSGGPTYRYVRFTWAD